MRSTLKNIPYSDTTKINKIPKKIFVLIIANMSNPFESLTANICVIIKTVATNTANTSKENNPIADVIIKNQKENPAVTARLLNRGEESSILNRINECYKTALC